VNKRSRLAKTGNVVSLQLVRKRARQPRGGSNERLKAENAQLRASVVDLLLQIRALRDALAHPQSKIRPNRRHRLPGP